MTARRHSITSAVETVTPAMAKEWLAANGRNRHMRSRLAADYARDMKEPGRWALNGEPIKFGISGRLLDGQHRLEAIIIADKPIDTLVVRGIADDAQDTMDSGAKRTAADALGLAGIPNSISVAAATRRALIWERSGYTEVSTSGRGVTHREIIEYLQENPDIQDAASHVAALGKAVPVSRAVLAFAYWACARADADHAHLFFDSLASGAQLGRHDPILALRNKLQSFNTSEARAPIPLIVAYIFKAWNLSRDGRSIQVLKFMSSESYPVPK